MKVDLSDTVLFNNFFSIVWFNLKLNEPVTGHIGFKGHECEWEHLFCLHMNTLNINTNC